MTGNGLSERERLLLADDVFRRFLHYIEPQFRSVKKEIEGVKSLVRQSADSDGLPIVSQTELAAQLRISLRTLRRWRSQGLIGGRTVKGRRGVWFTSAEAQRVKELMVSGEIRPCD